MRIGFFGATSQVTGSCFCVETSTGTFLVDCGLIQGGGACSGRNYEAFGFDVFAVQAVVVTHTHEDHIGRLPRLVHLGTRPRIVSTPPTRDLARLILDDAQNIMLEEAERCGLDPLYEDSDVQAVYGLWEAMPYRQRFEVIPQVFVTLFDAGHILGSAFALIEADGRRVVVSGDIGSGVAPLLHKTERLPEQVDLVVCDATYGNRLHPTPGDRAAQLKQYVTENLERKGVLLIPAFSVERTQEIVFELNQLVEHDGLKTGPVYLDSPLSINASEVFAKYWDDTDYMHQVLPPNWHDEDAFVFEGLRVCRDVESSKAINDAPSPKVIIAGSGMMDSGRIQHHLLRYLDRATTTVLITGYQGEGTLGRRIQEGAESVDIRGYAVNVRAKVVTLESYSAHGDYATIGAWLEAGRPDRVALVHGSAEAKTAFSDYLNHKQLFDVHIPETGEWLDVTAKNERSSSTRQSTPARGDS